MKIEKVILGPLQNNTYIIYFENINEFVVIDPSFDIENILSEIKKSNIKIKAILLTHAHIDHIAGVLKIKESFPDSKVYMGEKEQKTLLNSNFNLSYLFPGTLIYDKVDFLLKDGEKLNFGNVEFEIITTPGHTIGSICYYIKSENILFTGDTLFYKTIGRSDFPGGNFIQLVNSIVNRLFTLPDNTDVMPGHGVTTSIKFERENNQFVRGT